MEFIKHNGIVVDGCQAWIDGKQVNEWLEIFDIKGAKLIGDEFDNWADPHHLRITAHFTEKADKEMRTRCIVETFMSSSFAIGNVRFYEVSNMQLHEEEGEEFLTFEINCSFRDITKCKAV